MMKSLPTVGQMCKTRGFSLAAAEFSGRTMNEHLAKAWCLYAVHGRFVDANGRAYNAPTRLVRHPTALASAL